ncbi:MAG TPA: hypothetical protein VFQ61_04385 [Polyangiaceae bacterium]|nr:hypothetical protein [Polyangiaceae bacterium]
MNTETESSASRLARWSSIGALAGDRVWRAIERAVRSRRYVLMCLVSMVLVRIAWVAWIEVQPTSDFTWYYSQGLRIASGQGYTVEHTGFPLWESGTPLPTPRKTAFWPVGYSGFLGVLFYVSQGWLDRLGSPLVIAKLANVALSVITVWGTARLSRLWFKSELTERLTLLVAGFAPNQIAYVALTACETYYTALLVLGVLALAHAAQPDTRMPTGALPGNIRSLGWALASGVLFGLATLTKPQTSLLPAALLLIWAPWRQLYASLSRESGAGSVREDCALEATSPPPLSKHTPAEISSLGRSSRASEQWTWSARPIRLWLSAGPWLKKAACVYVPLCLVVLPWSVRNYLAFGEWVAVSTNGWMNLAIGNMPGSWGNQGLMWNRELHEVVQRYSDELSWNAGAKSVFLHYVQQHPLQVIAGIPGKLIALYTWDVDGFGWARLGDLRKTGESYYLPLRVLSQMNYLAAFALAAYAVLHLRRALTPGIRAALVVIAYFTVLYTIFFGGPRFHFPVMPFIYMFAAAGLARLISRPGTLERAPTAAAP